MERCNLQAHTFTTPSMVAASLRQNTACLSVFPWRHWIVFLRMRFCEKGGAALRLHKHRALAVDQPCTGGVSLKQDGNCTVQHNQWNWK